MRARILALATNPASGASTRYRVLQWRPHLEAAGFALELDAFYSEAAAMILYRPGHRASKLAYFLAGALRRWVRLARAARMSDLVLVHREAFPFGLRLGLGWLRRCPGPLVYDYDDAMFLPQRRGVLARLENLETPNQVMAMSRVVLAGNRFLAAHARQYADHVVILPTCVDTSRFRPRPARATGDLPTVGWIGSHSTARYLAGLRPALEAVARKVPFRLYVVGSLHPLPVAGVDVRHAEWALEREAEDFARCDVGVYPLSREPWVQGKCGLKSIQFMACGVPVVAEKVGVNCEIIQDGVNGFLAETEDEWVDRLVWLLSDDRLREDMGRTGRATVEDRYSVAAHAPRLVETLRQTVRSS